MRLIETKAPASNGIPGIALSGSLCAHVGFVLLTSLTRLHGYGSHPCSLNKTEPPKVEEEGLGLDRDVDVESAAELLELLYDCVFCTGVSSPPMSPVMKGMPMKRKKKKTITTMDRFLSKWELFAVVRPECAAGAGGVDGGDVEWRTRGVPQNGHNAKLGSTSLPQFGQYGKHRHLRRNRYLSVSKCLSESESQAGP